MATLKVKPAEARRLERNLHKGDEAVRTCNHHRMYFKAGMLTCYECGIDKTPLSNERIIIVRDDYREKVIQDIQRIVDGLPANVLKDIELFAEYLKWRRR